MSAHAIVLAAGAGERFGGGKMTTLYGGKPLVCWAVKAALEAPVDSVTVVLGDCAPEVRHAASGIDDARLRTIVCANWRDGISASLACGVRSLPDEARAALIFLGDMPHVSGILARQLLDVVLAGAPTALAECNGKPAHPVAIARDQFESVCALTGDRGARRLLEQLPGAVRIATGDAGALFDIDCRDDLKFGAES